MGLLTMLFGGAESPQAERAAAWRELSHLPQSVGPLTLESDGSFGVGPLSFDQSCSLQNTNIGGAAVNKAAGINQVLAIDTPRGQKLRFRFDGQTWFALA